MDAIRVFKALGSSGNARIDFLIDDKTKKVYINEINLIPGLLSFYLWEPKGKSYSKLLDGMINIGIKDYKKRESKTYSFETNILAGYKAVGESVEKSIMYYRNNLDSTLTLLELMKKYNVKKFIFSSSATVYGTPEKLPLTEDCKTGDATNPYGETKIMIERILTDVYKSDNSMSIILLRYFNPIGSHKSYLLGENSNGIPNNLMPYIVRVADGELDHLSIYGDDYNTPDGTGVRDYIHVVDLAKGHIKALEKAGKGPGLNIYNLGTGHGYSVLDIVKTFEKVNNVKVPYEIVGRRAGDIAACYADPSKAEKELGWKAEYTLDNMCLDSYQYILNKNKTN